MVYIIALFLALSLLSTILVVSSCMLSSQISQGHAAHAEKSLRSHETAPPPTVAATDRGTSPYQKQRQALGIRVAAAGDGSERRLADTNGSRVIRSRPVISD